jgi:hypothetical protein
MIQPGPPSGGPFHFQLKEIAMTNDLHLSNIERTAWADEAIKVVRLRTRCDHEDSLGDLLADLMHWADENNFDFEAALIRACGQYEAETQEGGES